MKKLFSVLKVIGFLICTGFVAMLFYGLFHKLELPNRQITIYDNNDSILYTSASSNTLQIEECPSFIKDALLCVEDKRFYSHLGFDPIRIMKSLYTNLLQQQIVEGGSTITQQYAKNIFLSNQQTWKRKFDELFYAIRLEMQYSKEEILEGYLNSIYYGHGIYGLKNAAFFYFGKDLDSLSIAEIALLIGIPNGPSYYSPILQLDNAYQKRNTILSVLYQNNLISKTEYEASIKEVIQLDEKDYQKENEKNYYIDAVLAQINNLDLEGELHVYTYFDKNAQSILSSSIQQECSSTSLQSSGIVVEPYSGNIIALSGGVDYSVSSYNRALYAKRQIASTIKPLLYYCALYQGFTPSSTFSSEPTTFSLSDGSIYEPVNYNHYYPNKEISLIHALRTSDNIYAVKTHLFLGCQTLQEALSSFGFVSHDNPSLALGTINLSIYELSLIYNTFASEGYYIEPSFISYIRNKDEIVYERTIEPKQLLDRDITLVLNQLLTSTYDTNHIEHVYPTLYGNNPSVKTAVKSGTSDWDTWAIGFNPYYTVGIWNGYDDNTIMQKQEYEISKTIWKNCFNGLMKDKPDIWYEPSKHIIEKQVDPFSGESSAQGSVYWYLD